MTLFKKGIKRFYYASCVAGFALFSCSHNKVDAAGSNKAYYFSQAGNDASDGSRGSPWKTISKLNTLRLNAGDTIFFEGGQTFNGSILIDSGKSGTMDKPLVITSYGNGKAIINAADLTALTLYQTKYINITRLSLVGAGRKTGNTKDGLIINNCQHILLDSLDITGFQKSGLLVYSSFDVAINRVYAFGNGATGILVTGNKTKNDCANIHISYCTAGNNPGDPTNFTNHSGNGILAGMCKKVTIEYCVATNNGWDMPRKGNGPVGIWTYESDSILIQYCLSYRNKTSAGAADGGGFDLDGGVTNSIIQYCLSYENQGSGFGIFQYAGASNWYNNTIRFCISENDGSVSAAHAGVFVWNSSGDSSQFKDFFFYNNAVYNTKGAAISYENQSKNAGFHFYNNVFVAKDSLITGKETNTVYLANNWYSLESGFNIDGIKDFETWAKTNRKEQYNGKIIGFNINPAFTSPGHTTLVLPGQLSSFYSYKVPDATGFKYKGIDLKTLFGIETGNRDFNQQPLQATGIGASF